MRVPAVLLLTALAVAAVSRPAGAEVFHDAEVKQPGNFEIGVEPQFEFDTETKPDHRVYLRAGVGLFDRVELDAKVGLLNQYTNYFGGELRYGAIENGDGYPALMIYAGAHWIDRRPRAAKDFGGADGGITISETIWEQSFYAGYDVDADYIPELERLVFTQRIYAGVKMPVSEHLSFFIEGAYGIRNTIRVPRNYVSGGVALFF
jgi:hypothetical protein